MPDATHLDVNDAGNITVPVGDVEVNASFLEGSGGLVAVTSGFVTSTCMWLWKHHCLY